VRPNPKFHVDEEQWALWLRPPEPMKVVPLYERDWEVNVRAGERRVVPMGHGRQIASVHFGARWLLLRSQREPEVDPTTISWLSDLCEKFPEVRGYALYRHSHGDEEGARWVKDGELGEGFQGYVMALGNLGSFCARVTEVVEHTPTYDEPEDEAHLVEHRYRRIVGPADIPWYHATRLSAVPAIMREGLIPKFQLEQQRGEERQERGWAPGWHMDIQDAVYLTRSPEQAARIAETLALRYEEDSAIIEVEGAALRDPSLVVVDEDALGTEFSRPSSADADPDFPEYWTSLVSIGSLGYRGRIEPSYLRVVAFGRYRQERYYDDYRGHEVVDEDFELESVEDEAAAE
jgi:hypothetical protein